MRITVTFCLRNFVVLIAGAVAAVAASCPESEQELNNGTETAHVPSAIAINVRLVISFDYKKLTTFRHYDEEDDDNCDNGANTNAFFFLFR